MVWIPTRALISTPGYCVHISHVLVWHPTYRILTHVWYFLRAYPLYDNFWNLIPRILLILPGHPSPSLDMSVRLFPLAWLFLHLLMFCVSPTTRARYLNTLLSKQNWQYQKRILTANVLLFPNRICRHNSTCFVLNGADILSHIVSSLQASFRITICWLNIITTAQLCLHI